MMRTDIWGMVPGLTTAVETYESAIRWGPAGMGLITGGVIDSGATDPTNSPTWELRHGLVLGQITSSGNWTNYSPTATNGSEVASGVLITDLRIQDMQGTNQNKFYGVLVAGPVQSAKLIGLDLMARAQLSDHFFFDDPLLWPGFHWFPWRRFLSKAANYTIVASDNFTLFDNTGATGAVTFTLPTLANGYFFGFRVVADQTVTVASAEGDNMLAFNDNAADSVAFSTGGQKMGGGLAVYSNPAATLWVVGNQSAGANTITVAT